MRVVDLFCGGGGFSEGFRQAGFDITIGVDKWQTAVLTHQKNHPSTNTILGDVEKISMLSDEQLDALIPDSEIIIGSPPCVDFSSSNRSGKGDKSLGIVLIESFLRIVARKKFKNGSILKYWILENVPNSQKYIKEEYTAKDLGLSGDFVLKTRSISSRIYNAQLYGVPSKRLRFICGDFPEPEETVKSESEFQALGHILNQLGKPKEHSNKSISDPNYKLKIPSQCVTDHHYIQEYAEFEWKQAKRLKEDKGYMGKMSFPENLNKPSRTIMATLSASARESLILPLGKNRYRAATIREVACLMSFPLDYQFYGDSVGTKYRLVGNAVPPKLAYAIAKAIAQKENLIIPTNYLKLNTSITDSDFVNLNWKIIPMKSERNKRGTARFKYHIPYMIEDAFRVELTNYKSDFENLHFRWDVEIHKSQGITAKIYTPDLTKAIFNEGQVNKVDNFITKHSSEIKSANEFQRIHCLTESERIAKKLVGPHELLIKTRNFLDQLIDTNNNKDEMVRINQKTILPIRIATGYYILKAITAKLKER